MTISRRRFLQAAAVGGATAGLGFAEEPKPKKLVMIAGKPSHGRGAHEFNAGVQLLATCLANVDGLKVEVRLSGYPKDEAVLDDADGILLYADGGAGHPFLQDGHLKKIGSLMAKGVGLMCAHYGVEVPKDKGADEFRDWIGGCYEHSYSCNPIWSPEFREFPDHPIARGVKPFTCRDEWYFNMRFRPEMKGVTPILSAKPSDQIRNGPYVWPQGPYRHIQDAAGRVEHMMWAVERPDGGRGVGFTGGHFHQNWQDDGFRKVVLNALLWISKIEVPKGGVESRVMDADMAKNLDPKPK